MAAPAGPFILAANDNRPALDFVPVDVSATDKDLTDPDGITGGICARSLYVTGAGDVAFYAVGARVAPGASTPTPTIRTVTVAAKTVLQCCVAQVNHTSTTATGIFAML